MLPDYSKVIFPSMDPISLSIIMPEAHQLDLDFLANILVLDPKRRLSASQIKGLGYFSTSPFPAMESSLQVILNDEETSRGIESRIVANTSREAIQCLLRNAITIASNVI
jgi:hypothetical protein